ncbi:MAG: cadherin-like domain-containing protein, partial [Propionibacterium sp.]|nr:cadherin-like domain-containing protein [Propionibacterium sp.]
MAPPASRSASRRGWARRAPAAALVATSLVLSTLALLHEGVTTAEVDVNDGGIWVTNQSRGLVGHLNYDSRTLDAALRADSTDFDIAQHADTVTFSDHASRAVAPIEVAAVRLGAATSLAERAEAVQGGDRLGILDAGEGTLWVASAAEPSSTPLTPETAVADNLEGGVVSAGVEGTVMAVSATTSRLTTVTRDGTVDRVETTEIEGLATDAQLSLTAVGALPVALDATSNTLVLPDGRTRDLSAEGVPTGGVLQEPGPEADAVLLATADALVSIPLDGGAVTTTAATRDAAPGDPARPVRHQGCDYAAWAGSGAYVRVCEDPAQNTDMVVDTLKGAGDVQFRTNRTRIVLNDIGTGSVWLPDQHMVLMDDWDQVEADLKAAEQPEDSPQLTDEIVDPERKESNTPPEAVDDEFGIRPGRTTTLPVLQNDSDPDGDVLTARPVTQPDQGTINATRGGQALQVTGIGEDATGTLSFTYEASDGQAVDTASVNATVHPWDVNSGPTQLRDPGVKLGAGAEIEYNVLPDWIDPDGDPIFLQSATAPEGIQVSFREEGTVSVRDLGAQAGSVPVEVVVSDGRESTTGTLTVLVQPQGNLAPTANADFYVARVGEPQTIEPLANDTDPNGDTLTLVGVSPAPAGTTVVPDLDLGTLTFTAQSVGTHQFTYTVTDGPSTAVGVVRVDVVDTQADATPVAEDDLVVLPAGGAALAAPLDNDSDPAGGVLVVQSLDLPDGLPLEVTLVDRHLLRVTAPGGLDQAVSFSYTVSNGTHSATARVTVVPTSARDDKQPPELQPDRVKVRVGDIASVPVLQNDRSPAGLALRVDPELQYTPEEAVGRPFVTGNLVRLEAGETPGVLHVAYTVRDSAGNMATSTVMFEVVALDGANAAPRPRPLTAWAVSGQTTRIPVPLNGIDPDGDSVTLVGIAQAPQKGTVALGVDWLEYTPASSTTGTDVFTYIVEDRQGKQATARVRVGIAPPSDTNQNPTAVRDTVLVRPDRQVAVAVLANDIDADGDPLSLVPDSLGPADSGLLASQRGNLVVVTSPSGAGSHLLTHRITDGRGGYADGTLTVNVSPDAPLQPHLARD